MSAKRTTPEKRGLVVALDGPASSGKSSVGAAAAAELSYRFCDTGLLYRAVTWLALQRGIDAAGVDAVVRLVPEVDFGADEQGRLSRVNVDGQDVTRDVHGPDVDAAVSAFSGIPELREALLERQRSIAAPGRIIMAGRDIGTVVLPDADLKIYLNASPEERARRRAEERGLDPNGPEAAEVLADLRRRDELDSKRAVSPLRAAPDARVIVTDGNRFEQTVAMVVRVIREAERATERTTEPAPPKPPDKPEQPDPPIESHLTPLIRVVAWGARVVSRAVARLRIEGAIDEIPREGPVILVANHASNADPVVIGGFLTPRLGRRIHWLGKKELFDWPVVGWAARNGGVHPVDRSTADLEAFRLARRILDEGHVLMVFPEGTRTPDGVLTQPKDGAAMLALRTGAPVVPIGVGDSDRLWPRGRLLPRPGGRVTMRVGSPFRLGDQIGGSATGRAAKTAATAALMRRIAELLPPRQRGIYGSPPDASVKQREPVTTGA
jgi:cytidylate kinase